MNPETAIVDDDGRQIAPLRLLAVGEKNYIKGAAKDPYVQRRRAEGYYTCTCPSWRNKAERDPQKSCNHLSKLLGEDYETARTRQSQRTASAASLLNVPSKSTKRKSSGAASLLTPDDVDVFPYAQNQGHSTSPKRTRRMFNSMFNGTLNAGPRSMNGAEDLLLASKWPADRDPTGFWLSEKLDGVRAWWDGQRMFARSGRAWNPPKWFRDRLPTDLCLDGELWMRRDMFDTTSGICRGSNVEGWKQINFMVFDVTNKPLLYEQRLQLLKERLPDGEISPDDVQDGRLGGRVCALPAISCESRAHFDELMHRILNKGGEGLMLRAPRSTYEPGRGKILFKHKVWYDAEGVIVGQEWGSGEHKGRMGGVQILMESGVVLSVGSGFSVAQRDAWQPPIGSVIRYRFQELSRDGTPRFPIYEGVCPDKKVSRDAIVRSTIFREKERKDNLKFTVENQDTSGPIIAGRKH